LAILSMRLPAVGRQVSTCKALHACLPPCPLPGSAGAFCPWCRTLAACSLLRAAWFPGLAKFMVDHGPRRFIQLLELFNAPEKRRPRLNLADKSTGFSGKTSKPRSSKRQASAAACGPWCVAARRSRPQPGRKNAKVCGFQAMPQGTARGCNWCMALCRCGCSADDATYGRRVAA
jgi:hypothetical protein